MSYKHIDSNIMTAPSKHITQYPSGSRPKILNVRICDKDISPWHCSFAGWILTFKSYRLILSRSCFDSLIWLKIRYICTQQILAYFCERILVTKENRSKEFLKVHVELCGHFCELRMIATKVRFFLRYSNIMTAPSKHILHNILPVLGLKCLNVRICDRDILPWHYSFAGWILTFKTLPIGFEQIMLRLSDTTKITLYLHSTDFSLSLRTYSGYKRKQKQRIFKSACWALRPLLWTTYDRDKSEILS